MSAFPDLARILAVELRFNPEDLPENRAGRLAPRQLSSLASTYLAFFGLTVMFPIGFFIWLLGTHAAPDSDAWVGFTCLALPLLGLGLFTAWDLRALLGDLTRRRVDQVMGQAHAEAVTRVLRARPDTRHVLHLGGRAFPVPAAVVEALSPERVYRAYYLPRSGRLVSIEVIG
jgi:hypothetical protein